MGNSVTGYDKTDQRISSIEKEVRGLYSHVIFTAKWHHKYFAGSYLEHAGYFFLTAILTIVSERILDYDVSYFLVL